MEEREHTRMNGAYDTVWDRVIPYVQESRDRDSVSLVCKRWYDIDAITRKHVTMALCYTAAPEQLSRRFPHLESLKLKGKPRAAMFNLIPEDWGGYVTPWVEEIARSFGQLKALHFRRMIVKDSDLELLARTRGRVLQVLKLDKCSGFSTDGLFHITRSCRNLKTLVLEESTISEKDGEWLHELATKNTVLENLNFYMTELTEVKAEDIELIARNCPHLVSMKISECDMSGLCGFFRAATSLEEFGGGSFSEQQEPVGENGYNEQPVSFPPRLCSLGLTYLGKNEMPILFPITSRLRRLDLLYALLDTESHCSLLEKCVNLEVLETRNVIGDRGLEVLARFCKRLKRLRVERGADEQEMEDEEGSVSQTGLIALAQGCLELEYLAVYVSDITNEAFDYIGKYMKSLCDFRLVLLDREERITDLPVDKGVRSLLRGCHGLRRFALYLRPGGLTDEGLKYIGQYSPNVRWMLLGYVGESDNGLLQFSSGCPNVFPFYLWSKWSYLFHAHLPHSFFFFENPSSPFLYTHSLYTHSFYRKNHPSPYSLKLSLFTFSVIWAMLGGERNSTNLESSSSIGTRIQQSRIGSSMEFESGWTKHTKLSVFTAQVIHSAMSFMPWSSRISISEGYHEFL